MGDFSGDMLVYIIWCMFVNIVVGVFEGVFVYLDVSGEVIVIEVGY